LAKELLGENCGKNSSRSHHDTRAKGPTTLDFSVITLFNTQTVMLFYVFPFRTPMATQLAPYFPHGVPPVCPDDVNQAFESSYAIDDLQVEPFCLIFIHAHLLEEPQ
jgi:hypothetical protein